MFIVQKTEARTIKLFTVLIVVVKVFNSSIAKVFVTAIHFQTCLIFEGKAGADQSGASLQDSNLMVGS
jgi:hypothetical protein